MEGKRLIQTLRLKNFLSFSGEGCEIKLEPLNVLIGPNAVGKSNLIEAIDILNATPKDLPAPIREGGGIGEWIWKGGKTDKEVEIEATISYPEGIMPLRYKISFTMVGQRFEVVDEVVEDIKQSNPNASDVFFYYRYQRGHPVLNIRAEIEKPAGTGEGRTKRSLQREDLHPEQSVLSQRKDPDHYPEITYLANQFSKIKLYREWNLGRYTAPRVPQQADLPGDFLLENTSNLGLVLNNMLSQPLTKKLIMEQLKKLYDSAEDITVKIVEGSVQIFIHEKGLKQSVPATRLSDGTLRYLCLLTLLCHPNPPPLLCIEEPELGLHPDILPTVAELLIDASQRTQLIVTTHSDDLVSALTETPESVVVCQRDEAGTYLDRLDSEKLKEWLEKYTLGDLRAMGEIGGTRW